MNKLKNSPELRALENELVDLSFSVIASKTFHNVLIIKTPINGDPNKVQTINVDYYEGSSRFVVNGRPLASAEKLISYCRNY